MVTVSQKCEKFYPLSEWAELYADFVNNFLTTERFAEYYGLTVEQASEIIAVGRITDNYSQPYTSWENAKESSVKFVKNHNNNCKCGVKMTLGSF